MGRICEFAMRLGRSGEMDAQPVARMNLRSVTRYLSRGIERLNLASPRRRALWPQAHRRGFSRQPFCCGKYERGGSMPPQQGNARRNQPPRCGRETASSRRRRQAEISLLIRQRETETACPHNHQRRITARCRWSLTPTNPLHQTVDGHSIAALSQEVQYMFLWISINCTL